MKLERFVLLCITAVPCAVLSNLWWGKSWSYFCGALGVWLYVIGRELLDLRRELKLESAIEALNILAQRDPERDQ